jgi:hypothetical protein
MHRIRQGKTDEQILAEFERDLNYGRLTQAEHRRSLRRAHSNIRLTALCADNDPNCTIAQLMEKHAAAENSRNRADRRRDENTGVNDQA